MDICTCSFRDLALLLARPTAGKHNCGYYLAKSWISAELGLTLGLEVSIAMVNLIVDLLAPERLYRRFCKSSP